jgi:hypothetical protein
MKTTHTLGPWSLEYDYSLVMPFKRGNYIVTAGPIGPSEADKEELRANARLIAASPELLQAAVSMIESFKSSHSVPVSLNKSYEELKAAIQKATQP